MNDQNNNPQGFGSQGNDPQGFGQQNANTGYGEPQQSYTAPSSYTSPQSSYTPHSGYTPPPYTPYPVKDDSSPMSVGDWLIMWLLLFIPCVNIILLFVWAFSSTGNISRKNFCRAYLIVTGAIFLLTLIGYAIMFLVLGAAFTNW